MHLLFCFLLSLILASPARAADQKEWQTAYAAGMQAVKAGNAEQAEKALQASLDLANQIPDKPQFVVLSLEALGKVYVLTKRPEKAEPLFKRALEMGEKAGGRNKSTLVSSEHLAELYASTGRYAEAVTYTKKAAALQEMINPSGPEAIMLRRRIIGLYLKQNQMEAAIEFLKQSIADKEKTGKVDAVLQALDELSSFYMRKGDVQAAEPVIKHAVNLASSRLGADDFAVAKELHYLVGAQVSLNKLDDALKNAQQECAIIKSKFGENHPHMAMGLSNLSMVYAKAGRAQEAEQLKAQAERIMKSAQGAPQPQAQGRPRGPVLPSNK